MIHQIFQQFGIPPDEVYNKQRRIKNFMYASMEVAHEDRPKKRNTAANPKSNLKRGR